MQKLRGGTLVVAGKVDVRVTQPVTWCDGRRVRSTADHVHERKGGARLNTGCGKGNQVLVRAGCEDDSKKASAEKDPEVYVGSTDIQDLEKEGKTEL